MKDEFTELRLKMQEIYSCLIVLQQAVSNENSLITNANIDDYLEIVIDKTAETLRLFDIINTKQCLQKS